MAALAVYALLVVAFLALPERFIPLGENNLNLLAGLGRSVVPGTLVGDPVLGTDPAQS